MDRPTDRRLDARSMAFRALQAFDDRGAFLAPTIDALCATRAVITSDRALAVELANGIMRRRLTLETVLTAYSARNIDDIETDVRTILQIGLYQLLFLDRVPPHAAVHETVQLCHRFRNRGAAGFVNGILRSVSREVTGKRIPLSGLSECTRSTIPMASTTAEHQLESIRLPRTLFPDPQNEPEGYLSQALSLPRWLVDRWLRGSSAERVFRLGLWFTGPGDTCLRVNLLRSTRERCLDVLHAAGVDARPGRLPEAIVTARMPPVENIPGFAEGWFSVQDESAMSAVDLLDPRPGDLVLDMCAAPGGKTTFLAERMRNEGQVVACDIDPRRLELVEENSRRLGLSIVNWQVGGTHENAFPPGPFDAILVDVPCSNTGVLGKRPEARWRLSPESLTELVPLQRRLLAGAISRVRPGGRIVYSTCSIEPEENEQLVQSLLTEHPHCHLREQRVHQPAKPSDGAYQALIDAT